MTIIVMHHASNEKHEMTHDRRNGTMKPRKNQNVKRKGNFQMLGNSEREKPAHWLVG